jgi:hypothetical protein
MVYAMDSEALGLSADLIQDIDDLRNLLKMAVINRTHL